MNKRKKQLARILALLLAVLLVLGTIASIVFGHAHGEETATRDEIALELEFFEEEQALQIRQRLRYTNRTGKHLDRVEFSVYANMFRRVTALMYEAVADEESMSVMHEAYSKPLINASWR